MLIGNKEFLPAGKTYIMGILNVTPDSFSDGGRYTAKDTILRHAEQMIEEGVDIIDIGGESTRPGYTMISDEEEIARIAPAIELIKERFNIPISLDTYKSAVAEEGIQAGADLINDIWGLKYDQKMGQVIAKHKVACCLMHNRDNSIYQSFMQELTEELSDCAKRAEDFGIDEDKIILDPGVGFAKSTENNLSVIQNLDALRHLGYPILLGASRKSVIGNTLDLPIEERLEGTIAISVIATMKGCSFLRVHDVAANLRAIRMTEAIMNAGN